MEKQKRNDQGKEQKNRKVYIDLLRIVSAFSVVMLHAAAQYWYTLPTDTESWFVCNGYDAVSRFGVPVFVMISGMLFLSREGETDVGRLYRKNIFRLAVVYFFWSGVYGLINCRYLLRMHEITLKECLKQMLAGKYHLWFLPMLIGIYMIVPVLKVFVDHCTRKQIEYFLLLFFVMQIGRETLYSVILSETVTNLVGLVTVELAGSYVGYFILGYYLYRYPPSDRKTRVYYLLGIAGLVCAVAVSTFLSVRRGEGQGEIYDSFSVYTFFVCIAIFLFFRKQFENRKFSPGMRRLIGEISDNTLGIYVMHLGLLEFLQAKGISSMSVNIVFGIPLLALGCFLICCIAAGLLRRLPFVGHYIC
ncbi:MAG: acyltransferase family protein [Lachnospiraceae bacterium]|nr:acyltransferase family protein [Lachnospiraceae bacterium]